MKQLQDKIAIVTGASSGIGKSIATAFAAEGASVVLASRRKEKLDEVAAAIRGKGGIARLVLTDVTVEAQVSSLFEEVREQFGRLDILVNNAGVTRDALLMRMIDCL